MKKLSLLINLEVKMFYGVLVISIRHINEVNSLH